jgi:outer membrane protein assembly factor BamB
VSDAPALANGSLYVPTDSGALVVLNADTGAQQWTGATGAAIGQQPAVAGGLVFTGSSDGTVSAFDAAGCGAATCTRLWNRTTGSAITGAPAVSDGQLYVGTADGRLVAYGL